MTEPEPMRQIHEIQEKIYEETKHISSDERLEYFHKKSEQLMKMGPDCYEQQFPVGPYVDQGAFPGE